MTIPTDVPSAVTQDEWTTVRARRATIRERDGDIDDRPDPETLDALTVEEDDGTELRSATQASLVGLAFSGGGIRSATFNLGVLQSLERSGVLRFVDYLSTVSGGGYLGSSLSAMTHAPDAPKAPYTDPGDAADPPLISHLRNYSNYMAPGGSQNFLALGVHLVRGLMLTTFAWIPAPLIAAIAVALLYSEQILYAAKGRMAPAEAFTLTPWVLLALALLFVVSPVLLLLASPKERLGDGTPSDAFLKRRAWIEQLVVRATIAAAGVALLEAQILLVAGFHVAMGFGEEGVREIWAASSGGLAVVGTFASRILSEKEGAAKVAAGILAIVVVLAVPVIVYAWAVDVLVFTQSGLFAEAFLGVPVFAWGILAFILLAWLLIDVNDSALHGVYRDRLSQAYVRRPDADGMPASADNLPLSGLNRPGSTAPYHLVNTALNLGGVDDLSLRGRSSDFFVMSKHWCGSAYTGWCRTEQIETVAPRIDLASAMATSAAAAAPNMGSFTNPLLRPAMVLLNARQGIWVPNPKRLTNGDAEGGLINRWLHRPGPRHLMAEFAGSLNADGRLVNLSDGGHIENLAIFELLRRRCRYIIAGDGEADPALAMGGLATIIRYARLELGVQIDLDTSDLQLDDDKNSTRHAITGAIHYPATATRAAETGYLLYIKLSVTGDEDTVINEYRHRYPDFPHQSTADQFFDEAQFEAYRSLGDKVGSGLVERGGLGEDPTFQDLAVWFERLHVSLTPRTVDGPDHVDEIVLPEVDSPLLKRWLEIPAAGLPDDATDDDKMLALRETAGKLQAMETEFLRHELDEPGAMDAPQAAGVLAGFRRRADSPKFRWAATFLLPLQGERFQRFASEQLGLGGSIHWELSSPDDFEGEGLIEAELDAPRPGEMPVCFLGRLKAPGCEAAPDGLPMAWMHLAVNGKNHKVRRLGHGMHPGFASRLRLREALLAGDRVFKGWLARKLNLDVASAALPHAFDTNAGLPEAGDDVDAALGDWDLGVVD